MLPQVLYQILARLEAERYLVHFLRPQKVENIDVNALQDLISSVRLQLPHLWAREVENTYLFALCNGRRIRFDPAIST